MSENKPTELSKCCKAPVTVEGDDKEGTYYFVCSKCDEPCDLVGNKPTLKERIFQVVDGANFKQGQTSNEATASILNLLKEELEGLTVSNALWMCQSPFTDGIGQQRIFELGKEAQRSYTIKKLKEKMG